MVFVFEFVYIVVHQSHSVLCGAGAQTQSFIGTRGTRQTLYQLSSTPPPPQSMFICFYAQVIYCSKPTHCLSPVSLSLLVPFIVMAAEIDLMYHWTNIILELGHIRQPFLIGPVCKELAVQNVFRRMLWV